MHNTLGKVLLIVGFVAASLLLFLIVLCIALSLGLVSMPAVAVLAFPLFIIAGFATVVAVACFVGAATLFGVRRMLADVYGAPIPAPWRSRTAQESKAYRRAMDAWIAAKVGERHTTEGPARED